VTEPAFTPTQRKILAVLSDGLGHRPSELHQCLVDELGSPSNIRAHLAAIRKKLRATGQDIICERQICYRQVTVSASGVRKR
jgi:DNA-binding CsgD family transcriptional regulator